MDKRTHIGAVVGELRDGMTIGFGGWGSRRKPMAIVREILRSNLKDLTIVSYGGPDVGLLCKTGQVQLVSQNANSRLLDGSGSASSGPAQCSTRWGSISTT